MTISYLMLIVDTKSNFFFDNWYYICALAIALTSLVVGIKNYRKKPSITSGLTPVDIKSVVSPTISPTNTVNVTVETQAKYPGETSHRAVPIENRESKIDALKNRYRILFIDDDKNFNIVKILKASGWKHTTAVQDLKSLDSESVRTSDIFFVDINGVGKLLNCQFEGLDLALMLKQRYPDKIVGIYSANRNNNAFHDAWDTCDFKLEKNALPYQFQSLVEKYSLDSNK